mmetsp:Transcript_8424/g.12728  ORF Transcript_8424/g.12728 Transcript_8424/m.12728 type:complete len:248 (-) Transcript_8424:16-759(-)
MFPKAHKEERFLYVIYPYLFAGAAHSLAMLKSICIDTKNAYSTKLFFKMAAFLLIFVNISLGTLRALAMINYNATYCQFLHKFSQMNMDKGKFCIKEDWHRLPGSFFLPEKVRIAYLEGAHEGQLPQEFQEESGTSKFPSLKFNDLNQEEKDRYIQMKKCKYILFSSINKSWNFDDYKIDWKLIQEAEVISSVESNAISRAFFLPFFNLNPKFEGKRMEQWEHQEKEQSALLLLLYPESRSHRSEQL